MRTMTAHHRRVVGEGASLEQHQERLGILKNLSEDVTDPENQIQFQKCHQITELTCQNLLRGHLNNLLLMVCGSFGDVYLADISLTLIHGLYEILIQPGMADMLLCVIALEKIDSGVRRHCRSVTDVLVSQLGNVENTDVFTEIVRTADAGESEII
eukprot:g28896.t1